MIVGWIGERSQNCRLQISDCRLKMSWSQSEIYNLQFSKHVLNGLYG